MKSVEYLKTNFTKEKKSKIIDLLQNYFSENKFSNQKVINKLIENLDQETVPEIFKKPKENEAKLQKYKCNYKLIICLII